MLQKAMLQSDIPGLSLLARGKVRDIYDLGQRLLIVATDRISCFDVVLPTAIPGKGRVLTQMSAFWFRETNHIVRNHFETLDISSVDGLTRQAGALDEIQGRAMLVKKARPASIEAVVRGYLAGSAWVEYSQHGTVCGIEIPSGLRKSDKLPEPIFTPATKAQRGEHDENISFSQAKQIVGEKLAEDIKQVSLHLYAFAESYAADSGLIIADTKFEFGLDDQGNLLLIDEILTPDSSRFWPADQYEPGRDQSSFDKQYVRDYLDSIGFNRTPPAPELPDDVVRRTSEKYEEALRRLTGLLGDNQRTITLKDSSGIRSTEK